MIGRYTMLGHTHNENDVNPSRLDMNCYSNPTDEYEYCFSVCWLAIVKVRIKPKFVSRYFQAFEVGRATKHTRDRSCDVILGQALQLNMVWWWETWDERRSILCCWSSKPAELPKILTRRLELRCTKLIVSQELKFSCVSLVTSQNIENTKVYYYT